MTRILAAAALAAVALPAGAFEAAAAPATTFGKSYRIQCTVNAADGEAVKVRAMVKNTTGNTITKGTPIKITFIRRGRVIVVNVSAWRDFAAGSSIGFDQPSGAVRCYATATVRPNLGTMIKRTR